MSGRRAKEARWLLQRWAATLQDEDPEVRRLLALTHVEVNRRTRSYPQRTLARGLRRLLREAT